MMFRPILLLGVILAAGPTGRVGDFGFRDSQGKEHTVKDWRDRKAAILVFLNPECPVSNGYSPELQRLRRAFPEKTVLVYGVYCDPDLTADQVTKHGKDYGLNFPLLLDPLQKLAAATGARKTPEAVLLSPDGQVRYRGRIDDRYTPDGKRRREAQRRDLEEALNEVLAGKAVTVAETQVFGCPFPPPASAK
ncbi:MAG: redoxin domain-containing protein [Gemmataceae bacterium]|nr:redoxin domain-containing protein [Gemmataceae bacterium]